MPRQLQRRPSRLTMEEPALLTKTLADEATSPTMAGSQNGCGQESEPDHPDSHTMSVDDDADII